MLEIGIVLLVVCVVLVVGLAGIFARQANQIPAPGSAQDYDRRERRNMPEELANGRLVISEETLWRRGARPLVAKTDQVFLTPQGLLVPVETKTHAKVSAADIVQLSAQAVVLRYAGGGHPVARWGYVRLRPPGRSPTYRRVTLLSEEDVDVLHARWVALRDGAMPSTRPEPYLCRNCTVPKCRSRSSEPDSRNRRS